MCKPPSAQRELTRSLRTREQFSENLTRSALTTIEWQLMSGRYAVTEHAQQRLQDAHKQEHAPGKEPDMINQNNNVLIKNASGRNQNDCRELATSTEQNGYSTNHESTHLIPEQHRGAFRYVRMLSLNPPAFVHTSRQLALNPARWICRNNVITDAAEPRQLHYRTGAWDNSPSSHFRAEKMMPEL